MTETDPIPHHMKPKADRLVLATHVRRVFMLTCPGGYTSEEAVQLLSRPEYLTNIASQLQPLDRLEVTDDDRSFYMEFIVLRADSINGAVLRPLRGVTLEDVGVRDAAPRDRTGLRAEYKGPHRRWCVLRGDEVLAEKLQTEVQALQWISQQTQAHRKPAA